MLQIVSGKQQIEAINQAAALDLDAGYYQWTFIGNCTIEGEGFEFLGYRFESGKRKVRKTSVRKLRDTIRRRTKRTVGQSMESVIESHNPTLIGWFGYFKHAHKWTFSGVTGLYGDDYQISCLMRNPLAQR